LSEAELFEVVECLFRNEQEQLNAGDTKITIIDEANT
jgi:hypothetical protein